MESRHYYYILEWIYSTRKVEKPMGGVLVNEEEVEEISGAEWDDTFRCLVGDATRLYVALHLIYIPMYTYSLTCLFLFFSIYCV